MNNLFTIKECEKIVKNLNYLIGVKKWSIAELSKNTNVGTTTLSQFLNGKKVVKVCTLQKICEALDVEMSDLLKRQY